MTVVWQFNTRSERMQDFTKSENGEKSHTIHCHRFVLEKTRETCFCSILSDWKAGIFKIYLKNERRGRPDWISWWCDGKWKKKIERRRKEKKRKKTLHMHLADDKSELKCNIKLSLWNGRGFDRSLEGTGFTAAPTSCLSHNVCIKKPEPLLGTNIESNSFEKLSSNSSIQETHAQTRSLAF